MPAATATTAAASVAELASAANAAPSAPDSPAAPALRFARLLGHTEPVRMQTFGVVLSWSTYLVYALINYLQVMMGLLDVTVFWVATPLASAVNLGFYIAVRSGWANRSRDRGLARTQLVVGAAFMYVSYATLGPAASGLLIVMASHVAYAMFWMRPRQVWILVGASLVTLAATMALCVQVWPDRYAWQVQASSFLYALLVMPLIALLAHRVTGMTGRLKSQHAELQAALGRLQELATRDELTCVHNRRHMSELLKVQQAHHRRLRKPLTVALIDLDRFKSVNDTHGHGVGDEVLRRFAQMARDSLRGVDQLARWGGEEFLVLMPQTQRGEARVALERLQDMLATCSEDVMPKGLKVSFSAGVVEIDADERIENAIDRADQAMYRAKMQGRARCIEG